MIRYLTNKEIDFEKWDACIDSSLNGILYAYSWYLDMTTPGWSALVEGDYHTVMPLPVRKKWGVSYVYQPVWVQQLGVFSTQSLTGDVTRRFLDAIPKSLHWIHVNLNTYNPLMEREGVQAEERINCELDLIPSYETLQAGYSANTRRNIKKAQKNNVFVTPHGQPEVIIDAFRSHRGKHLQGFSDEDYFLLKHLIYAGIHRGLVKVRCAYTQENNFCAGVVFFRSRNKFIFLFSGATHEARSNGAMALLVNDFIREHAGHDLVLDFEGSSDANLARFYLGFGSKECVFLQIKMNRLPPGLKQLAGIYETLRGR
jgi:hypothetical protein